MAEPAMAIQALVVDQASGVRSLYARILRSLGCATHEAADGGEALEALQSSSIDLAVVEAEAALLSGLDLLCVIRESETYANLPVVIVTAGTDQATVTEIVKLGAADCLTKPFDVEVVKTRLQRIVKSISAAGALHTMPSSEPGVSGSALIVDGNAEFRQFVAGALMATYATTQMETGLDALRACQVRKFSVLVMGTQTGLLSPRLLARRLRRQATLEDMRIVLVVPDGARGNIGDPTPFDAVLQRSLVPEDFARQFRQLAARSLPRDAGVIDIVRAAVASATQETLGMMAGIDVALLDTDASLPAGMLEASVVMTLQAERAAVRLALLGEAGGARRIAARIANRADDDVSPEDGLSALGEVLTNITGRVKSQIGSDGGPMTLTTPSLRTSTPDPDADVAGVSPVTLRFASVDGDVQLAVCLSVTEAPVDDALNEHRSPTLAAIA